MIGIPTESKPEKNGGWLSQPFHQFLACAL